MKKLIRLSVLIAWLSLSQTVPSAWSSANAGESAQDKGRQEEKADAGNKAGGESAPKPGQAGEAKKCAAVVLLQAVLHKSGEVRDVTILKLTPENLSEREREDYTAKATGAARKLRFQPPQKGGRLVSQRIKLEYCFDQDKRRG